MTRALRIALRTVHIGAACLVLGGAHYGHDPGAAGPVLLLTGLAILTTDLLKHGFAWLGTLAGGAVVLKLGLTAVALAWSPARLPGLWMALLLGGVFSHAPGAVRKRRWIS